MDSRKNSGKMQWKPIVLLLSTMAWASLAAADQHKPSAPASHPAPAAHAAAPHAAAPQHNNAPRGNTSSHTTPANHSNTAAHTNTGGRPNTGTAGHTNTAGHGNTAGAGHTNTAGHANPAGHANTTAGHGNAAGAHASVAGHGAGNRPAPGRNVALKGGGHASLRADGHIRSVDRGGMHIEHGARGGRRVVSEHNGARVVSYGRHGGYVQRAYVTRGGHSYYARSYYDHGHYRSVVYRGYFYGGRNYYGYYPGYYYNPGFYGWAYNPWASPISWGIGVGGWGWGGSPWYGFYGGYFNPYPVYPSAAFWLTDYLISANLQAAYAARQEAQADAAAGGGDNGGGDNGGGGDAAPAASNSGPVALTPEVKQAIAEEVKAQLAAEQAAAAQPAAPASGGGAPAAATGEVPAALDPARRTFVVDSDLSVVANGQDCTLTAGDVITRLTDTPDANQQVNVSIAASKKSDCPAGQMAAVNVDDIQEMHNHFQEQLDSGMKTLASKQGSGGIPKAPDTSTKSTGIEAPPPDTTAGKTLDDQQKAADQTEADVTKEAAGGGQ
jgi:hypothetical protein